MTMEWEAEQVDVVEKLTLRCIARSLPASLWLKLVQEAYQDETWAEKDREPLASTLISCLQENPSIAPLTLQYISTALTWNDTEQLCSTLTISKALLQNPRNLQISKDVLREVCFILKTLPISSFQDLTALYTGNRCTNAVHLMLLGAQYHDDSIMSFARSLLVGFCAILEDASSQKRQDWSEEATCLDAVQETVDTSFPGHERRVLSRLQTILEARIADRKGNTMASDTKRGAQEADNQSLFLSIMSSRQDDQSSWLRGSSSSSLEKNVLPEVANLLHFLIDDYSPWQIKLDAVKALFNARLNHKEAKVNNYEQYYLDLFHGIASGCATLAATPPTLGGDEGYSTVWRSALCGLLPSLIQAMEVDRLKLEQMQITSTRQCIASVVKTLFSDYSHILTGCEVMLVSSDDKKRKKRGGDQDVDLMLDVFIDGSDDGPSRHPVRAALLRSMEDKGLGRREDWKKVIELDAILTDWQDLKPSFIGELADGIDSSSTSVTSNLESLFEQKLQAEMQEDSEFFTNFIEDHASQQAFSQAIVKITSDCINSSELDNLTKVFKLLMNDSTALDVLFLYICPTQFLQPISDLLEDDELLQNEEEPAVIGTILLFAQLIVQKGLNGNYNLATLLPSHHSHFLASFIRGLPAVQVYSRLSTTEQSIVSNWITALFGSEGIPDELIKNSSPQLMLRITPSLFNQSVTACFHGIIDTDTLRGGLTYFLQDLLSYTLPSAITWLLCDISRCHYEESMTSTHDTSTKLKWSRQSLIRMEIISMLLLSENCPRVVQTLVSNKAIEVLGQYGDSSSEMGKVLADINSEVELSKLAKTHLWIKIVQQSMPSCTVDSLLNVDASISGITFKRGVKAALQLVMDNLLAHPKSDHLPRAIAMSLSLAHIARKTKTNLTDDILVLFANIAMAPKNRIRSVITTLKLVLEMLSIDSTSDTQCFEGVQAIIALRVRRMLKTAKSNEELHQVFLSYGLLFHHLDTCTILSRSFSEAI